MMASLNGHVDVVDKLLQCGARVNLPQREVSYIYHKHNNTHYS